MGKIDMKEYPKFKFEITKTSKNEIKIDGYKHVSGDHYRHNHLLLSINTIPEFIKVLGDKKKYISINNCHLFIMTLKILSLNIMELIISHC